MDVSLTRHATARSQQRGISSHAIECLLDFGTEHHDHHGAVVLLLDRAATKRLARSRQVRSSDLDTLRGLYAVLTGDGRVRTVGHRTRRLQRH